MNFRLVAALIAVLLFSLPAQAKTASPRHKSKTPSPQPLNPSLNRPQRSSAQAEAPSFRKGLWRFIRTLDIVRNANKNVKYRLVNREMTAALIPRTP